MFKNFVAFLLCFFSFVGLSQEVNFDAYKYVIVANKISFAKTIDEYQSSSLLKFLIEKKGFQAFLSSENFPADMQSLNTCNVLYADVNNESNMFTTKVIVELKDCKGNLVYASQTGKSKSKQYKQAYHESIRDAVETMKDFVYSYKPSSENKEKTIVTTVLEVEEITELPEKILDKNIQIEQKSDVEVLYAQPTKNGFQLVNMKPEVVFVLLKSTVKDLFLIKGKEGMVRKVGNNWLVEYYENEVLVKKEFNIKF